VLQFGDHGGAIGQLVGEENRGLEYMFIMMNAARFAVGLQGISVATAAYQKAVAYAKERVQSRPIDGSSKQGVPIIRHPDVRRMLTVMRALTEGARGLAYVTAAHGDIADRHPDEAVRARHRAVHEFLVPIVKGWSTEMSLEVTSLGVQVHGGMGFIEETGAAQYYRDARILPIYEGTTAIQANDLVGRKTVRDGGNVARSLLAEIDQTIEALREHASAAQSPAFRALQRHLLAGRVAFASALAFILANAARDPNAVYVGAVPYLKLAGVVLCGWQLARAALVAADKDTDAQPFHAAKIATAHCYAEHVLPLAVAFEASITSAGGRESVLALSDDQF
jgi:hypothetical protein